MKPWLFGDFGQRDAADILVRDRWHDRTVGKKQGALALSFAHRSQPRGDVRITWQSSKHVSAATPSRGTRALPGERTSLLRIAACVDSGGASGATSSAAAWELCGTKHSP